MSTFTKEECELIIEYSKEYQSKHISNYAKDLVGTALDYNYSGVFYSEKTSWVFERVIDFVKPLFPDVKANLITTINVHEFPEGGVFPKHIDVEREKHFYYIIGATISEDFTGGKLLAYEPEEELAPNIGKLYGMYATRPHEVTKVLSGTRWSMVCFLNRDQLGIKKSLI